jgi:hypothetical protein
MCKAGQAEPSQGHSRAHAVQEARVVGHNDGCDRLELNEVVLQPCHVLHVQMVGGLVQQQDVGLWVGGGKGGGARGRGTCCYRPGSVQARHLATTQQQLQQICMVEDAPASRSALVPAAVSRVSPAQQCCCCCPNSPSPHKHYPPMNPQPTFMSMDRASASFIFQLLLPLLLPFNPPPKNTDIRIRSPS